MTTAHFPHDDKGCPDLRVLVRLRGEQYAESIGEKYDPEHCPHHGGWRHITAADWRAWDEAVTEWQWRRRVGLRQRAYRDSGKERRVGATRRT